MDLLLLTVQNTDYSDNLKLSDMTYCKGIGLAMNYGCGNQIIEKFKYGLCKPCYAHWLYKTPEGKKKLARAQLKAKKQQSDKVYNLYNPERKKRTLLKDMSFQEMKIATQRVCNEYIRLRDECMHGICISSETSINDAGHFFSIGSNEALRYSPQNIHGQNRSDNFFKSGNLIEYEKGLRMRYGNDYMDELYKLHAETMKKKILSKDYVLKINKFYKYLAKKGIWITRHEEFENLLNLMEL